MFRMLMFTIACLAAVPLWADDPKSETPTAADAVLWKISKGLSSPTCVYVEPETQTLLIANIADTKGDSDKLSWITKADLKGNVVEAKWLAGLHGPHGMRSQHGTLWVCDQTELLAVNLKDGKVKQKIAIDGAKQLTDLAIDEEGLVYVSDPPAGKIYVVRDGKATLFAEGDKIESPSGLLIHDQKLVVASAGRERDEKTHLPTKPGNIFELDLTTKEQERVTAKPLGNFAGLEMDGSGGYYASDRSEGKVYHLADDGTVSVVLESAKGGAARICVVGDRLLIVPQTAENCVTAYDLQKLMP